MTAKNGKSMSREEAAELYRDLQKAMASVRSGGGAAKAKGKGTQSASVGEMIAREISKAMKKDDLAAAKGGRGFVDSPPVDDNPPMTHFAGDISPTPGWGRNSAIAFVLCVASFKVVLSAMEAVGFATVTPAEASIAVAPAAPRLPADGFSREEIKILTSLDTRRAELEERSKKIEARSQDLDRRDREFVTRLAELRDLTAKLGTERDRDQRKRSGQLEQLANVYGSMNPQEAAQLIEQLDVTIALGLIEKMPEKRIGQILATMKPEKALALTKLLSGKANP
jgi:flagellar motility protein MotE (MotC chaperone)